MKNISSKFIKVFDKNFFTIKINVSLVIIFILNLLLLFSYFQINTTKIKNRILDQEMNDRKQQSSELKAEIQELKYKLDNPETYILLDNNCNESYCLFDKDNLADGYFKIKGYYKYEFYPNDEYGFGDRESHQFFISQIPEYLTEELIESITENSSENGWYLANLDINNLSYLDKQKLINSTVNSLVEIKVIKKVIRTKAGPFTNSSQYHVLSVD